MRYYIIGLSILLIVLSVFITIRTLGIYEGDTIYKIDREGQKTKNISPENEYIMDQFDEEQVANTALVEELQATIIRLEHELTKKQETAMAKIQPEIPKEKARVLAVLGSGVFRSGQVVIDENFMNAVNELVLDILASPGYSVIIEGHTDDMPIKSSAGQRYRDNMELSFLRAKAVALILEKNGISLERISVIGYGDTRPAASNGTAEGRIKNRRVEVKLVPDNEGF